MILEDYIKSRHTAATAKRYLRDIEIYKNAATNHLTANYNDIMNYIGKLRQRYDSPQNIKCILHGIKKYYAWLVFTKQRKDHPCKFINLKEKRSDIQLQDLFSPEELELLLQRKERYKDLKLRNLVVLGLLIYQGITTGELIAIILKDIDLEQGEIYIKASNKQHCRTLKLKTQQILLLHRYITEIRPKLLKTNAENLILTKLGNPETGEQISYLVSTFKHLFPSRNLNPKTIRQSVITNLLKAGNDLRVVQVFAGHKYPSATEKYKQSDVESLKKQVDRFHPLK